MAAAGRYTDAVLPLREVLLPVSVDLGMVLARPHVERAPAPGSVC